MYVRYLVTLSTAAILATATIVPGCAGGPAAAPAAVARPDISGTWLFRGGSLRPAQGEIPLTPWGLERLRAERPTRGGANEDFQNTTDPSLRYADPNGYPRILMHPMKFKFVQTDDYVYQLWEYNQNWRQIALNKPHAPDPAETWYGDAVGTWEGDTLVVDSLGYKDSTWLDSRGLPHSADLHISERIHRDGESLVLDFTFDDPKAFTKPWSSKLTFVRVADGTMIETIFTISDELRFRERFLQEKSPIPIRR